MEWVFDGIGTEIISLLAGFLGGCFIGYKIGLQNKISQRQKGRNHTSQTQIGCIVNNGNSESRK